MTDDPRAPPPTPFARFWRAPYLLLVLTIVFWAGNFTLGRAINQDVPPIGLAFWRWTGGFLVMIAFSWGHLRRDWPVIVAHWRYMLLLSAIGVAAFNTLVYIGLHTTTAVNASLLQSAMPLVIIVWSFLLFGERPMPRQIAGIAVSTLGVTVIVGQGSPAALLALSVNPGDALVLIAIVSYAAYSALLRRRPRIHPLSFVAVTFALGATILLPLYGWETAAGDPVRVDWTTILSIVYVAIFPSCLSYLFFNRGVELIGANRAGQFLHLMPVFGSLFAVVLLGESFRVYHAAGIVLIGLGIWLATREKRRRD